MGNGTPVGLVGLGLVGKALASRLIGAGQAVVGYDISDEACSAAGGVGVEIVDAPAAVPAACRLILLSLPNSTTVDAVLWGDIDLFPTSAELCGAQLPPGVKLDGRSLVPLLKNSFKTWYNKHAASKRGTPLVPAEPRAADL